MRKKSFKFLSGLLTTAMAKTLKMSAIVMLLFGCMFLSALIRVDASDFTKRCTPPDYNSTYYSSNNGYNGYSMPNCTAYVYGRLYELTGSKPKMSHNNADKIYSYNKDNNIYSYSSDQYSPALGAIVCYKTSGVGHVQIVEEIGEDAGGKYICVSESNYSARNAGKEWKGFNYIKIYLSDLDGYTSSSGNHAIRIKYLEDNDGYSEPSNSDGNYAIYATFQGYVYAYGGASADTGTGEIQSVFTSPYVENVTISDATMGVRFSNTYYVTKGGLYFGTDPANLTKLSVDENGNAKKIYYNANKWIGKLQSNTTYYYKVFATIDGIEYVTDLQSFKTANLYAEAYVKDVSETNAVIKATLNDTYYLSTAGVYFGTDASNLQKITETANGNAKWLTYDVNKWIGTLHPGTNYYYQVYVVIDGVEHRADLQQFTTLDQSKPNIDLVEIVEVTATGYTVRCKVSDNGYVEKVCFPTWTDANGQDDICGTWDVDTAIYTPDANGYYSFRVETSAHNNESGRYITHIYAYDTAGNVAEVALTGCEIYQLQSISLSSSSYVAKVGEEFSLTVNYNPDNTTENKAVMWSTSNSAVAVVDDGKVTAKAVGTATITANVGGKIATCDITVESAEVTLQSISLSKTSNSVKVGETFTLSVSYNPSETTTDKTVSWKSSDTNVATVDSNGKVTAKTVGNTTITAQVADKTATCNVIVQSDNIISSSGIYLFSVDRNIIRAGMTTSLKESTDIEYRWTAYSAENPTKVVVQDWTTNDEWLNWEPEEFGEYRLICEARIKNEPSKVATAETDAIRFTPYIKGKCQMPYTGEGGGYLIGIETYENPNQSYQYEMLILDCTLLAQGKDAWVWSTGRYTVPEGNAGWCVWQPQYGYYWTLFRVYDADGNMIDQDCYGFVNAY